jgi:hypothetical protein
MLLLLGALVMAAAASSYGPQPEEVTTEELIRRHIEAIGGEERLRALRTLKKTGAYVYNGHEHGLVSFHAEGRRSREEIDGLRIWGTGVWEGHTVVRGTNGSVAWNEDASRSSEWREIPKVRAQLALDDADIHGSLLDYTEKGYSVAYDGLGELDGAPVHRLKLTVAPGLTQVLFIDVETFLLRGKELVDDGLARDLERPRAWFFDDYREVNGVLLPFWVYIEETLFSREYVFDSIEGNVAVDDAVFEPTEEATQSPP